MDHIVQPARRYDLDWLRIVAFGLLILYHTGMFYVSWDWHVKSVHAGTQAEWLMRLLNPWRLALLFFISGLALRFAADKLGPLTLSRERIVRLGLPIIFGMAVIIAPQSWLELVEMGEFDGSLLAFWPIYLNFGSDFSVTTPTWNHLWYIVYLLPYTLILAPLARPVSRFMSTTGRDWSRFVFSGRFGVAAILLLPMLPFFAYRILLDPHFPTTHALVDDWANHAHSFTILLIGFVLAKDPAFWSAVRRATVWAGMGALVLGIGLTLIWSHWDAFAASNAWAVWPARLARIAYAWLAILTLLGLSQRWLNRPSRVLTYMTEAIFPWYILHQTLTIMAGFWLTRQGLPVAAEASLVLLATFGGCAVLHECVIRRAHILRPLFGLKLRKRSYAIMTAQ